MQTSPTLLTASTLALSLGLTTVAQAEEPIALSFDLAPIPTHEASTAPAIASPSSAPTETAPLPIPPEATQPPLGNTPTAPAPQNNSGGGNALALPGSPPIAAAAR